MICRGWQLSRSRSTLISLWVSTINLGQHLLLPIIPVVFASLPDVCAIYFLQLGACDRVEGPADARSVLILNPTAHERIILALAILNQGRLWF